MGVPRDIRRWIKLCFLNKTEENPGVQYPPIRMGLEMPNFPGLE